MKPSSGAPGTSRRSRWNVVCCASAEGVASTVAAPPATKAQSALFHELTQVFRVSARRITPFEDRVVASGEDLYGKPRCYQGGPRKATMKRQRRKCTSMHLTCAAGGAFFPSPRETHVPAPQ